MKVAIDSLRRRSYSALLRADRLTSRELRFFQQHERDSLEELQRIQRTRLAALLEHAGRRVPYYRRRLREAGVVDGGNGIRWEGWLDVPVLTKACIRAHYRELLSDDLEHRKWHENRTGGSTGEPLRLVQEKSGCQAAGGAALRWFYSWHGIRPGDREVKLWGSVLDLYQGAPPFPTRARRRMAGVRLLNAFEMTPRQMEEYVNQINRFRPLILRGYSSNLHELASFILENGLTLHPPRAVISSAGKLYRHWRGKMESAFGAKVFDHYGTREVHNVAAECVHQQGLHTNSFTHLVEIVDENGGRCPDGVEGRILITTLFDMAMPLIRYEVGDRGRLTHDRCGCGRSLPRLLEVTGRSVDCFRTRSGGVIPGEYFIHLLGVVLTDNPFAKIQVVQRDFDWIEIHAVFQRGELLLPGVRRDIEENIRRVMGTGCRIDFVRREKIPTGPSGKYRYTICALEKPGGSADAVW